MRMTKNWIGYLLEDVDSSGYGLGTTHTTPDGPMRVAGTAPGQVQLTPDGLLPADGFTAAVAEVVPEPVPVLEVPPSEAVTPIQHHKRGKKR